LVAVGCLVGGVFGAIGAIITEWDQGPELLTRPVQYTLTYHVPPQRGVGAVLTVEVFGLWRYMRTAPDDRAFAPEIAAIDYGPGIAMIGLGTATGAVGGALAARWRRRRPTA
jgi:hypothetical protein